MKLDSTSVLPTNIENMWKTELSDIENDIFLAVDHSQEVTKTKQKSYEMFLEKKMPKFDPLKTFET